jgi:uncharacterized protein (TIGR00297 family)
MDGGRGQMNGVTRGALLPAPGRILGGLAASGAIGALAYRRGALSRGGVAGAVLTGTTIFAGGGREPASLLITFFVGSSALSHWRKGRKAEAAVVEAEKGARRDLAQTLANGGVAALLVLVGRALPSSPWFPALVGALATANADTWATEIGLLHRRAPRLITTGRAVPPGTSGGISPLGTGAAAAGAALIGAVAALGQWATGVRAGRLLPLGLVAGLGGAFADSLLGATVQARYRCPRCVVATERTIHRCGTPTVLVGGFRAIDNDAVNAIASSCGAAIGWAWGGRVPRHLSGADAVPNGR